MLGHRSNFRVRGGPIIATESPIHRAQDHGLAKFITLVMQGITPWGITL